MFFAAVVGLMCASCSYVTISPDIQDAEVANPAYTRPVADIRDIIDITIPDDWMVVEDVNSNIRTAWRSKEPYRDFSPAIVVVWDARSIQTAVDAFKHEMDGHIVKSSALAEGGWRVDVDIKYGFSPPLRQVAVFKDFNDTVVYLVASRHRDDDSGQTEAALRSFRLRPAPKVRSAELNYVGR